MVNREPDSAQYETHLGPKRERQFWSWLDKQHQQGQIQDGDYNFYKTNGYGYDYDFRAAFDRGARPNIDPGDGRWHWPDLGKKPNHSTFSNESKYANDGNPGRWEGGRFIPPTSPAGTGNPSSGSRGDFPSFNPEPRWKPPGVDSTPLFHDGQPVKSIQRPADKLLFKLLKDMNDTRISMDEEQLRRMQPPASTPQKPFVLGSNGLVASDSASTTVSTPMPPTQRPEVWGSNG